MMDNNELNASNDRRPNVQISVDLQHEAGEQFSRITWVEFTENIRRSESPKIRTVRMFSQCEIYAFNFNAMVNFIQEG